MVYSHRVGKYDVTVEEGETAKEYTLGRYVMVVGKSKDKMDFVLFQEIHHWCGTCANSDGTHSLIEQHNYIGSSTYEGWKSLPTKFCECLSIDINTLEEGEDCLNNSNWNGTIKVLVA